MFWKKITRPRKGETGQEDQRKQWLLTVENIREANIVTVGGGARLPVLRARTVAGITQVEVQEVVEVNKAGKDPGLVLSSEATKQGFYVGHGACIVPLNNCRRDKNVCGISRRFGLW